MLLGQLLQDLLGVGLLVLPLVEGNCEGMVQAVEHVPSRLLGSLTRLHILLPLVQGLGDDAEVSVLEEQRHNAPLHSCSLRLRLLCEVFVDVLGLIA